MPEKTIIKICEYHGECEFAVESPGTINQRIRCKKCRVEAVARRRRKLKRQAIEYKGGKCQKCGYDKCDSALEFHHLDPTQKEFGIGNGDIKSFEKIKKEVDKCQLLCSNCHRELHDEELIKVDKKVVKTCPICEKHFEDTIFNKRVYCTQECSNKRGNRNRNRKKVPSRGMTRPFTDE